MSKSKGGKSSLTKKTNNDDGIDSDTSIEKYYHHDDGFLSSSSSSSSTTSKSSPLGLSAPKMFVKKPAIRVASVDEQDPFDIGLRRPSNPLVKPDAQLSFGANTLDSALPIGHKKDDTPISTMKLGSDTLDEEQEKAEFFRNLEEQKGETRIDYTSLNRQLELDLSPARPPTDQHRVASSFEQEIHQMSTPLHHLPADNTVQESLSNELDRELEHEKQQTLNATGTNKHVTIVEPPVRPSVSIDDFNRTGKTMSDCRTLTSDTTRDFGLLHNAYKQTISSLTGTRPSRTQTFDPKKKIPPQKTSATHRVPSKATVPTPTKKGSPSAVTARPKTAPSPVPKANDQKQSNAMEQLKLEKDLLEQKIEALVERHDEELRQIRQDNYILQAQISALNGQPISADGKIELTPAKQRDMQELEKLVDGYQVENEKLCKQIKHIEQQHKQIEHSMFDENEKLRQELVQTKMLMEQYENSHLARQNKPIVSSTIQITNLGGQSADGNEQQRLRNEISVLKHQLAASRSEQENRVDGDTSHTLHQRRIKDLERQVKELELIHRRHHQNPTSQVAMVLHPSDERTQLEKKLAQAEQSLRERQIQEDQLVQQYNALQMQYSQLKELGVGNESVSKNLSVSFREPPEKQPDDFLSKDKRSTAQLALRRENERLKAELDQCKQQQTAKPAKSLKRDLETIKLLRLDLERKNDELEKLRALYDAVTVQHKSLLAEREREKTRLAMTTNKPYQPDRFTQVLSPVETVHAENEQLKYLVNKLEHDSQQQHSELIRLRDDRHAAVALALRDKDDEIASLRQQHKLELQTMIKEMSANTTETRVSDLLRKLESQDATIAHLKTLSERAEENARDLAAVRTRENEWRSSVQRLERELTDARAYHTPEMKHFQELQHQIDQLEQRWHKRDQLTKDYSVSRLKEHDVESNNDITKLRAIIKQKNREIERFHLELDSMLQLLKTLKFQQLLQHR